jgi:hypothetical protein
MQREEAEQRAGRPPGRRGEWRAVRAEDGLAEDQYAQHGAGLSGRGSTRRKGAADVHGRPARSAGPGPSNNPPANAG